jgi:SH3 domain-containing YSC84-like protein 1
VLSAHDDADARFQKGGLMGKLLSVLLLGGIAISARATTTDDAQIADTRLDVAKTVIDQIMSEPDKSIPESIARSAVCVGVVPGMVKGAFLFGADYGQGVVTCRTENGWSAPVFIRMTGGSWGVQARGQATDLVLVAVNDKGMQDLLKDEFKIGEGASAAAGPVGRDAQAATEAMAHAELLTWSRSRGVFAGIDLNGVSVTRNMDETEAVNGSGHSAEQLLNGEVPPPNAARGFLDSIQQYFGPGHSQPKENKHRPGEGSFRPIAYLHMEKVARVME